MSGQGILDKEAGFRRKCKTHPYYKAYYKPRVNCPGYWYMFLVGCTSKRLAINIGKIHSDYIDVVEACCDFKEE